MGWFQNLFDPTKKQNAVEVISKASFEPFRLKAGDILVVTIDRPITAVTAAHIKDMFTNALPEGVKAVVVDNCVSLTKIAGPEDADPGIDLSLPPAVRASKPTAHGKRSRKAKPSKPKSSRRQSRKAK